MNPTCNVLESRYAQLEGGHPLSGLSTASGMTGMYAVASCVPLADNLLYDDDILIMHSLTAIFYSIINLASKGDNIGKLLDLHFTLFVYTLYFLVNS